MKIVVMLDLVMEYSGDSIGIFMIIVFGIIESWNKVII